MGPIPPPLYLSLGRCTNGTDISHGNREMSRQSKYSTNQPGTGPIDQA